ncbi:hypothetical protein [Burkholderia sp. Ac-20379]|uniref:hypothetical protein n=1 Tax=Burkholderia sp. Ac-20379 TaxID=2703900 RepID=UPI0019814405|nr:hypothetical protein [Burkholderia sp. Ac-20379]MBN3728201.1 hypothetical protein [Burkholderia sp. Ac-20379]
MNDEASIEAIAERIQRYLCERPASADTTEGVHQWWLGGEAFDATLDATQAALALLARRGVLDAVKLGHRTVWRLARPGVAA